MAATKKIGMAARRRLTDKVLLKDWEREFRTDFAGDGGARFESLLERFGICTGAQKMLEGSVNFVTACATFKTLDGVEIGGFLADQRYESEETLVDGHKLMILGVPGPGERIVERGLHWHHLNRGRSHGLV